MKELNKNISIRKILSKHKQEKEAVQNMNSDSQTSQISSNYSSVLKTPIDIIKKEYLLK